MFEVFASEPPAPGDPPRRAPGSATTPQDTGSQRRARSRRSPGSQDARHTRPIRVLALEDDTETCDMLEMLLSGDEGFELETCFDVDGCLEHLRRTASNGTRPYDVLLLDLFLTEGHMGTEVIMAAQADPSLRLPPVVAYTAGSGVRVEAHRGWLDACNARFVSKPFDVDVLIQMLREAAAA